MSSDDMGLRTEFVDDKATSRELHKAKLVIIDGPDEGEEFTLDSSKTYVGRAAVNDIQVSDSSVSGTHFEIRAEEDGFLLRDAGSTNGTILAGCNIEEVWLSAGTSFRAGNTTFKIEPLDDVVEVPLSEDEHFQGVIGRSAAMREVFATCKKVAPSELTCLITGETGTGKERIAQAIHDASRRSEEPYVVLDCSAIPKDLMESYVFGHEKGAFTGAHEQKPGAFEQAEGGTLFMDEIGELDPSLQPKLLRVLENREFKRVGGTETHKADVRVIAATNRELRKQVNEGDFREDLYFRLSVIEIELPPLKNHRDDIPLLVEHFLDDVAEKRPDRPRMRLTADAMDMLMNYPWPGNVRELQNVIRRAANLATGESIDRSDLRLSANFSTDDDALASPSATSDASVTDDSQISLTASLDAPFKEAKQSVVDQFERAYLERSYEQHDENISQASGACGLTRYHFRELLKKHDLKN
jgi:transcriptional regulator with GAF, ATPase, and Fis domain